MINLLNFSNSTLWFIFWFQAIPEFVDFVIVYVGWFFICNMLHCFTLLISFAKIATSNGFIFYFEFNYVSLGALKFILIFEKFA